MSAATIEKGATAPDLVVGPVTRTDFVRYAGASGDFNPIHHDEAFAISAGFPSVFSVGMWQAGILGSYAADWLGAEHVRRLAVRFREQVWPGDTLTFSGAVVDLVERDHARIAIVELSATRQTGGVAISATAEFAIEGATP